MKPFIFKITLFLMIGFVFGEFIARRWHLTSEFPQRFVDRDGIQKYIPNQTGYWKGGGHQWQVNKLGWVGVLPKRYDNLITVIGDSFIENFMNPDSCHQGPLLSEKLPGYNFLEVGRSGVSFIEAMEIASKLDSLQPRLHLIYVNASDFTESVQDVKPMSDITQVNLREGKIVPGVMNSAKAKKLLYTSKFVYYLYNRFPLSKLDRPKRAAMVNPKVSVGDDPSPYLNKLLKFAAARYDTSNKVLVFHPGVPLDFLERTRQAGFKYISLDASADNEWTFAYDHHWTCYGHERAAAQIAEKVILSATPD